MYKSQFQKNWPLWLVLWPWVTFFPHNVITELLCDIQDFSNHSFAVYATSASSYSSFSALKWKPNQQPMLWCTSQYGRKDLPLLPFHHDFRVFFNSTLNACLPPRTIITVCEFRVAGFKHTAGVCSALADAVDVLYRRSISHLLVSRFLIDLNHQILQLPRSGNQYKSDDKIRH